MRPERNRHLPEAKIGFQVLAQPGTVLHPKQASEKGPGSGGMLIICSTVPRPIGSALSEYEIDLHRSAADLIGQNGSTTQSAMQHSPMSL